jgi:hypothetical protein
MEIMSPTGRDKELTASIHIRMSAKLRKDLEALARADDRDLSEYCRRALEQHAKDKSK